MTTVTRAEAIAETLREAILNGQYLSGERMIEVKLAQTYEVSQNTVRDALRILEGEGWVVKNPRHGVYVRSFSAADAVEVCALIGALEALALTWVTERLDRIARADLRSLLNEARRLGYVGERDQAFDHLVRFHERIGAAGRPLTRQFLERLYIYVRLLEALREARSPRTAQELTTQIAEHEMLLRAIDAGDSATACEKLRELITNYSAIVSAVLSSSTTRLT
ncbi:MAG: GntR family transcriptional regulator [Chloroflexota bacterium]